MRKPPAPTFGGSTCLTTRSNSGRHALLRPLGRGGHPALLGRAVDDREIELLVGGVERGEQVEHFVDDLGRPRVVLVDLVDADDRLQADLQRLADHEFGLRHRPFGGVDQHDGAVDHRQNPLDLAAEIGVAGGVDDIDAHVLPHDRRRLGENGDAALAFEVVGVHHALGDALVLAEGARLLQQPVDERRLAVVDVGDDGDVAQFHGQALKRRPWRQSEGRAGDFTGCGGCSYATARRRTRCPVRFVRCNTRNGGGREERAGRERSGGQLRPRATGFYRPRARAAISESEPSVFNRLPAPLPSQCQSMRRSRSAFSR